MTHHPKWFEQRWFMLHLLVGVLALLLGLAAAAWYRSTQEEHFRIELQGLALRHATQLEDETLRGPAMGAVLLLGVNEPLLKAQASGQLPPNEPSTLARLHAVRQTLDVHSVYVLDASGTVVAHATERQSALGDDMSYRPFWQRAMAGVPNVYPAVGYRNPVRGFYVAAPIYSDDAPAQRSVLGVVVVRLVAADLDDRLRQRLNRRALLVSPQGVVFASTDKKWRNHYVTPPSPELASEVRTQRQFGDGDAAPSELALLPFDVRRPEATLLGERHLLARASVGWQDARGRWQLVVLAPVSGAAPWSALLLVLGGVSGCVGVVLWLALRGWRDAATRRAVLAQAEASLHALAQARRLEQQQSQLTLALQHARDFAALVQTLFQHLGRFVPVQQGTLYRVDSVCAPDAPPTLHLAGVYATGDDAPAVVPPGEGLLGQCALERRALWFDGVAAPGFWRIASGLGQTPPRALALLPLVRNEQLLGVLELASTDPQLAQHRAALEAVLPVLAMNMEILLAQQRTTELLAQARHDAEHSQAQQAYSQDMEHWYQSILSGAPDAIVIVADDGGIIFANRVAQQLFGHSADAFLRLTVEDLLPARLRADHVAKRQTFANGSMGDLLKMANWRTGLMAQHQRGHEFPVAITLANIPAIGQHARCVCVVIRPAD